MNENLSGIRAMAKEDHRTPSFTNRMARSVQQRVNKIIQKSARV